MEQERYGRFVETGPCGPGLLLKECQRRMDLKRKVLVSSEPLLRLVMPQVSKSFDCQQPKYKYYSRKTKDWKRPKDPKKPMSPFFLFSRDERPKVKAEFLGISIAERSKEIGRRWKDLDPGLKSEYEKRCKELRQEYDETMAEKGPNHPLALPKEPPTGYMIYQREERLKVRAENPGYAVWEESRELGRRWKDMAPEVKERYTKMADEARKKYDEEMHAYHGKFLADVSTGTTADLPSNVQSTVVEEMVKVEAAVVEGDPATYEIVVKEEQWSFAPDPVEASTSGPTYVTGALLEAVEAPAEGTVVMMWDADGNTHFVMTGDQNNRLEQ